jgi:CheY-like chemotaxis protein
MSSIARPYKATILVVEDEPILRMTATTIIEDAGFEVLEAENADQAIRLLESRDDIQLVFTDIDMPRGSMNGLKLAVAVRHRWPPIAIIVVSGHRIPGRSEMPEGATFFAKPYLEKSLIDTMHQMLRAAA